MSQIMVQDTQDYTIVPLLGTLNALDTIIFQPTTISEGASVAVFESSQFDGTQILSSVNVFGSTDRDVIHVSMNNTSLDLSGLVFGSNWFGDDLFNGDHVSISGTTGADNIVGSTQYNVIGSGTGDDIIEGNSGDYIRAGDGDDIVTLNAGGAFAGFIVGDINAEDGIDTLVGNASLVTYSIDFHTDSLGQKLGFEIFQLTAGSGSDFIFGGAMGDLLNGNGGNDMLWGGGGDDVLIGLTGRDELVGDAGDDQLMGGDGGDELDGGIGNDTLYGENGNDSIDGDVGDDIIIGGTGSDIIDGGANDDWIEGGSFFDIIDGGAGSDTLLGESYADVIDGGSGNDMITGGTGRDTLGGGGGIDMFHYNALAERGDTIEDFNANDFMVFKTGAFNLAGFTGIATVTQFVAQASGHAANLTTQRFIYDQADDSLWYDSNGSNAGGTIVKIADFNTTYNLNAGDIMIVT